MATLNVIRRWALRENMSIREISRRTGMARNTVKKYLRSDETEPTYAKRVSSSKLDPYAEKLATWLGMEATKSRKQRRNLKQIYTDLVALGFDGSYGRVAAFSRKWREERQEALKTAGRGTFIPLLFGPGEAFQFDWSEDWAVIAGERTKLQVAHFKLSHSRAFSVRAYLLQTHEMLFDAHNHAFSMLGGIPKRGIYDNMKTAVDKVRSGKDRDINARFNAMVNHYLFEAEFPAPFKRLQALLLKKPGGDREMVEILALVLHHDEQAVLAAVETALDAGVATKTHILNILHRLVDGKTAIPEVIAPQALRLATEPQANVGRYDSLRRDELNLGVRHGT